MIHSVGDDSGLRLMIEPTARRTGGATKVRLGWGVLSIEVPIPASVAELLARVFRRRRLLQKLVIVHSKVEIRIQEVDKGDVFIYLRVLNLAGRPVSVTASHSSMLLNGSGCHDFDAVLGYVPDVLASSVESTISLRGALRPQDIRLFVLVTRPSCNPFSSPQLDVSLNCSLAWRSGRKETVEHFSIERIVPDISVAEVVLKALGGSFKVGDG